MFMKGDQQFVLPPWAKDQNTAKCSFCGRIDNAARPEGTKGKLTCSGCGGILLIAGDIATATSDLPWTTNTLEVAKEVMKISREAHDQQNHAVVKEEVTEPKGKRHKSFIHQCFGHDQGAIEGSRDCEDRLKQALAREMAERNAAAELEGAVKIEKIIDVPQDDDGDGEMPGEKPNPNSQKADNEDGDHFGQPEFSKMDPEVRKRAKEVFRKLMATITEIPRSLQERSEMVVETAVSNDDRLDSHLTAHDTAGTYKDKRGVSYGEKGARSSIQLTQAVGPPQETIHMPLPGEYPSDRGFRWLVVDDCWNCRIWRLLACPWKKGTLQK